MNKEKYSSDLVGKKYNKLTVVSYKENTSSNGGRCECLCDCGKTISLMRCQVVDGRNKSCGCLGRVYVIGKKFGKLTVYSQERRNKRGWANCVCDCGNIAQIELYKTMTNHTRSCGCIKRLTPNNKKAPGIAAKNHVFCSYKKSAKTRNLEFSLTDSNLETLITSCCHYCGKKPSNTMKTQRGNGDFIYNGIDRKNNDIGYTIDNCVTCCKNCNFMKGVMSVEGFLNHINIIVEYQNPLIGPFLRAMKKGV